MNNSVPMNHAHICSVSTQSLRSRGAGSSDRIINLHEQHWRIGTHIFESADVEIGQVISKRLVRFAIHCDLQGTTKLNMILALWAKHNLMLNTHNGCVITSRMDVMQI